MNFSPSVTFNASPRDPPPMQPLDLRSGRGSVAINVPPPNIANYASPQTSYNSNNSPRLTPSPYSQHGSSSPVVMPAVARSGPEVIHGISLNAISSTFSVASSHGFRVYKASTSVTNPRIELGYDNPILSSSKVIQLHSTNFFITVGDGSDASSSSRIVRVIDITTNQEHFSLKFTAPVLNVLATVTRLVVILAHKLYVFDLDTCRQLHSTSTAHNPHGTAALYDPDVSALRQRYVKLIQQHSTPSPSLGPSHPASSSPSSFYPSPSPSAAAGSGNSPGLRPLSSRASPLFTSQAQSSLSSSSSFSSLTSVTPDLAPISHPLLIYPVPQTQAAPSASISSSLGLSSSPPQGVLEVLDLVTLKPLTRLQACAGSVRSIAIGGEGHMVAVASTKGTIIRVLNTLTGQQLFCFRRGHYDGDISHLVFTHKSEWLACVNAVSNSIHIFSLDPANRSQETIQEDSTTTNSQGEANSERNSPEFMSLSGAPFSQDIDAARDTTSTSVAPAAASSGISGFFSWSSLSAASSVASSLMKSTASSLASSLTSLSSTIHSYIEPPRRYAWVALKPPRPHIKPLCVGFTRAATMIVATSDGMVYVYTIPKASGECALVHQVSLGRGEDGYSACIMNVNGQTVPVAMATGMGSSTAGMGTGMGMGMGVSPSQRHNGSVQLGLGIPSAGISSSNAPISGSPATTLSFGFTPASPSVPQTTATSAPTHTANSANTVIAQLQQQRMQSKHTLSTSPPTDTSSTSPPASFSSSPLSPAPTHAPMASSLPHAPLPRPSTSPAFSVLPPVPTPGVPSLFNEDDDDPMFQSHVFSWTDAQSNPLGASAGMGAIDGMGSSLLSGNGLGSGLGLKSNDMDIIPEETASEANSTTSEKINISGIFGSSHNSGSGNSLSSGKLPSTSSESPAETSSELPLATLTTSTSLPSSVSSSMVSSSVASSSVSSIFDSLTPETTSSSDSGISASSQMVDPEKTSESGKPSLSGIGKVVSRVVAGVDTVLNNAADVGHCVTSVSASTSLNDTLAHDSSDKASISEKSSGKHRRKRSSGIIPTVPSTETSHEEDVTDSRAPTPVPLPLPLPTTPSLKQHTSIASISDTEVTPVKVSVAREDNDTVPTPKSKGEQDSGENHESGVKNQDIVSSEAHTCESASDRSRLNSEVSGSDVEGLGEGGNSQTCANSKKKKGKKGKRR